MMTDRDDSRKEDPWEHVHKAVEELRRRVNLHCPSGWFTIRIDTKQGGVVGVKIGGEENFPKT